MGFNCILFFVPFRYVYLIKTQLGMRYTANHTIEIGFGYRIEQEKDSGNCGSFADLEDEAIAHSVLRHLVRYQ